MTSQQKIGGQDQEGLDDMDDFDLLDATVDPKDVKTLQRVHKLNMEIEYEKNFISMKLAYRKSMVIEDPMGIAI